MPNKKSSKKKTKKVSEIIEIKDKNGKEKEVKLKGKIKEPLVKKGQIKEENKTLRNVLLTLGVVIVLFLLGFFLILNISNNAATFTYRGLKFQVVNEIAPYRTELITNNGTSEKQYNFFIRNDPRALEEKVPFDGTLEMYKFTAINYEQEFNCNGKGVIGLAELSTVYQIVGSEVVLDKNSTCDPENKYQYLEIKSGKETKITQESPSCYTMYVKDCEILQAQERLVVETFIWINENRK